jgi:hypothetical protein
MDLGSSNRSPQRAYDEGGKPRPTTLNKDYEKEILPAFKYMSEQRLDTKFLNHSENSRLPHDVIPKLPLA